MAKGKDYKLPDRPARTDRPTRAELEERLARLALLKAGREGKN